MAILVGDVPAVLWGGELEHWCLCPRPLPRTNRVPRGPSNNQFLRKIPDPEIYILLEEQNHIRPDFLVGTHKKLEGDPQIFLFL